MNDATKAVWQLIKAGTVNISATGKIGQRILQPAIAQILTAAGYDVDLEDARGFFPAGLPAWRQKPGGEIAVTTGRRRIDLIVHKQGDVVALIETESDLNDLREQGVSARSGHYDVFSVARSGDGTWFNSYKSLERMAAAAWYATGRRQSALEDLQSESPDAHNPSGVGLILVAGSSREMDRRILAPRLHALGASLVSIVAR